MRDCGECHVGGGAMEYMVDDSAIESTSPVYMNNKRVSLRDYNFKDSNNNVLVTAFNALIDIFNPTPANKGNVVVQDYAQTGVLEMDCLICHQNDYSWEHRKDAVRQGKYDASRAVGSNLAVSAKDGMNVFYDPASVTANTNGELVANLEYKIVGKPTSNQCTSCHLGSTTPVKDTNGNVIGEAGEKYQVDWKKRGEMWSANGTILDVHGAIGCMGCHERTGAKVGTNVGTDGIVSADNKKLGLCDPAKGGASPFDAMWNPLDKVEFKDCSGCHEYVDPITKKPTVAPFSTFGAPNSKGAHDQAGLNALIAYDKSGNPISHIGLIDCTACHIKKSGFSGGAFVDGTGADEEGRLAVHDTEYVAKGDMANGVALHWQNGKIYAANLLTSFFWRDMNGLKGGADGGLDVNNDGRTAGMDPLLQTHVNNINIANGLHALTADGIVTAAEIKTQAGKLTAGLPGQLGLAAGVVIAAKNSDGSPNLSATNAFLPKLSFLMVPFKASHNIAGADKAWGAKGCKECHSAAGTTIAANDSDNKTGAAYTAGGFYNGAYPINGNMDGHFTFDSDQVTAFTKVNGLVDPTDSHPNVFTKDGTRSVPVKILSMFDTPYVKDATTGQTLRNIDRSEVLYEATFQTVKQTWESSIQGGAIAAACNSASPFYCDNATAIFNVNKKGATSTLGWTLKVDVKTGVDADGKDVVVSRTVQVGNDKVTTVDQLVTELGSFGDIYFSVANVSNSIKLTANSGYSIRINKLSDVGPFGLKNALWQSAAISRTAQDGSSLSFAYRSDYVNYLNTINPTAFGVGVRPVATIAAIGNETGTTAAAMTAGVAQTFSPVTTPAAGAVVRWETNAGDIATITNGTTKDATITFSKPGTYRVSLTVTSVDGAIASSYKLVNVKLPVYVTFGSTTNTGEKVTYTTAYNTKAPYTVATVTTKLPVSIDSKLVAGTNYDRIRIFWGDGSTATTFYGATLGDFTPAGVSHVYNRYSKYLTPSDPAGNGTYNYKTTVQLFLGNVLVNSQSVAVAVPETLATYTTSTVVK
ncbi:PKD domain-containing protein [Geomonas edaphica]|uniref:PKD domain-containing protein n=1 Tax=Geomonas edaphica TaxID=2570226 RepID=UPI0010A86433|nr:PKD domain-containing protein [Geomonas edaphica]